MGTDCPGRHPAYLFRIPHSPFPIPRCVMGKLFSNTDALAGAGAVVVLLVAVLALNLALPIGLGLAAVAYVGLRLALPKAKPQDQEAAFAATLARCEEQVTAIQQFAGWAGFAGKPEVRVRLLAIHRIARRILT